AGSSDDFGIDEVVLNDGQTYYIVISTQSSSSTDYTLTIDEAHIDCADYTEAPEGEEEQYTQAGFTLEDLEVKGSNLTWYDDSTLGNTLPETTSTVDGDSYYVTQTLNGCESDYLEVTVEEIDCSELEITDYREVTVVCKGKPTLEATGADKYSGSRVFWYKNVNTEDVLHRGNSFRVDDEITQNRSFWVAEVLSDGEFIPNQGMVSPSGTST